MCVRLGAAKIKPDHVRMNVIAKQAERKMSSTTHIWGTFNLYTSRYTITYVEGSERGTDDMCNPAVNPNFSGQRDDLIKLDE